MSDAISRLSASLSDRYVVERELGAGGMATVYLAHDVRHDRKVALKVLRPELSAILGGERFLAEIKTTANLQHPHILSLFDSGEADGLVFYVMPYVEGESLRDRLNREKQLPVDDAVRIAREVADALEYAHQHGIVHRDIKPENILLHGGHAQVADFGIALAASRSDGGSRMTETGMSLGTPHYMAPEQAMGEREITPKADIYALGVVLYEMLTAEPPFVGATAQAIIARVMTEEPRSLTLQRRTIPPHVEAAVRTALEKLPADRFATAAQFADALGRTEYAVPVTRAAAAAHRTSASGRIRALAPWALAAVAAGVGAWGWLRPEPPRDVLRYTLELPDSQGLHPMSDKKVAISPDGRVIAYVGPPSSGSRIWIRRRDALVATPLPGTEGATNPSFSPDGARLAYIATAGQRALRVVPVAGGAPTTLTDSLVDRGGVSWGHDGYIYYDGHLEGDGVARIRASGGRPEVFTRPRTDSGETYHNLPYALPGGRGVLFASRSAGGVFAIAVADARTGAHRRLFSGASPSWSASGHLLYVTNDGSLMAVAFDARRLRVRGEPFEVASGVAARGNGRGDLVISNSGTMVYLAGSAAGSMGELVWVTRAGVTTPVDPGWTAAFGRPAVSPSGRQIAVSIATGTQSDIWVKQLDAGPRSRLTFDGRSNLPVWSPDGRNILFTSANPPTPRAVFRVPADGSALPVMVRRDSGNVSWATLSNDGAWLVTTVAGDLYATRMTGDSTRRALVVSPFQNVTPALSPDGRWLAYMSDESGTFEVYVRPFPDAASAKWQVSVNGGLFPRWSRDGRELFFNQTSTNELAVARILPGAAFAAAQPQPLFSLLNYIGGALDLPVMDVSPDGSRFLMVRRHGAQSQPDQLIVVENVFAVLNGGAPR